MGGAETEIRNVCLSENKSSMKANERALKHRCTRGGKMEREG